MIKTREVRFGVILIFLSAVSHLFSTVNMYYFVTKRNGQFKSQFQALGPILIQVSLGELQNSPGQKFPHHGFHLAVKDPLLVT